MASSGLGPKQIAHALPALRTADTFRATLRFSGLNLVSKFAREMDKALAEPKTDAKRLAEVEAEALNLYCRYKKDIPALFKKFEAMGVRTFDGGQLPWVNNCLSIMQGADALVLTPGTLFSPDSPLQYNGLDVDADSPLIPILQELNATRSPGILFKRGWDTDTVFHELFHMLQIKHGLHFAVQSPDAKPAHRLITKYYTEGMSNGERFKVRFIKKPWIALKKRLGLYTPHPNAELVRIISQRELETVNFLVRHAEPLGLENSQSSNQIRQIIYQRLAHYAPLLEPFFYRPTP